MPGPLPLGSYTISEQDPSFQGFQQVGDVECTVTPVSGEPRVTTNGFTLNAGDSVVCSAVNINTTYRVVGDEVAVNLAGEEHTFTFAVEVDRKDGQGFVPAGAGIEVAVTVGNPSVQLVSNTCATGTDANGECTVVVNLGTAGSTTVTATAIDLPAVPPYTDATFAVDTADATQTKNWITFAATVTPENDVNRTGDAHQFTITATYTDGTTTWPVPAGTVIAYTWDAPDAAPVDGTCEADANGQCVVERTSNVPGEGILTVTGIDSVLIPADSPLSDVNKLFTDVSAASVFTGDSGAKTWVAYDVTVTPLDAENVVGDPHQFVVTVTLDDGSGPVAAEGVTVSAELSPTGIATLASPTCVTGDAGTCTFTATPASAGTVTLTVTTLSGLSYDAYGTPVTLPDVTVAAGAEGSLVSGPVTAEKTWFVYRALIDSDADNPLDLDHEFVVTVQRSSDPAADPAAPADDQSWSPVPAGTTLAFTWLGPDGGTEANAVVRPDTTCDTTGTAADGTCSIWVTSTSPGAGTLTITGIAGTPLVTDGVSRSEAVSGSAFTGDSATKTWYAFAVDIAPPAAENPVGTDHTFTVTVWRATDLGNQATYVPVSDGTKVLVDFPGPDGEGSIDTDNCGTTGTVGGVCTVIVSSTTPGTGTLTVTGLEDTVLPISGSFDYTFPTSPASATKTWLAFRVIPDVDATNLVGDAHTFTLTVQESDDPTADAAADPVDSTKWRDAPDGTTVGFADTSKVTGGTCTTSGTVGGDCTVIVDSDDPGSFTLTAETVTVTLPNGQTAESTTTWPDVDVPDVDQTKTWVRFLANVETSATNLAGDPHPFTITAWYDDGSGAPKPANGATVAFDWNGAGAASPASSCTMPVDANTCTVTVSSAGAGSGTITVTSVSATVNGEPLGPSSVSATPPTLAANGSLTATKTWIALDVDLSPSAVNPIGAPHDFVVTTRVDLGDGQGLQAYPATVGFTWTGDGSVTAPAPGATSCTTDATTGECTVTVSHDAAGSGTLTVTSVQVTVGSDTFTVDTTAAGPGQAPELTVPVEATKIWVALFASVEETATNLIGDDHTFTITVEYVDETGAPKPAPAGTVAAFDWTGDGTVTEVNGAAVPADTRECEIVGDAGQCTVTVSSATPGSGTITVVGVTSVVVGGVELVPQGETLPVAAIEGGSLTATKTWVDYRVTVDPPTAENLVSTEHVFTVTVEKDSGDGNGFQPLVGAVPTITITGAGFATDSTCLTGTDAAGQCTVTITSDAAGQTTVQASFEGTAADSASRTYSDAGVKTWVDYRVTVDPEQAENLLGVPHTFTVTVERSIDGETWTPVEGATPTAVVSAPATITANTCAEPGTDADGECTVTVESPTAATVTLSVTYLGRVGEESASFGDDGTKTWITYRVDVDPPTAENLVGTEHVFTVTVAVDRGDGQGFVPLAGATPTITVTGAGSLVSESCTDPGTGENGTCTVTITSSTPGSTTVAAGFVGSAGVEESANFTDSGVKTWVDYRLTVLPETATNQANDPHTFTVTLERDSGAGFQPASGETVAISASGTGSITAIVTGTVTSPTAGTCTTNASGQCTVTVNSATAGSLTITATYNAMVGETTGTRTDSGTKTWVAADLTVVKVLDGTRPVFAAGETIGFTLTVSNLGPNDAVNAVVTDPMPATLTGVAVVDDGPYTCTVTGNTVTCTIPVHPVGVTATIRLRATIVASVPDQTVIANVASVSSDTFDPNPNNNSDDSGLSVVALPVTGSDPQRMVTMASIAVGFGLLLLLASRRRRPESATAS